MQTRAEQYYRDVDGDLRLSAYPKLMVIALEHPSPVVRAMAHGRLPEAKRRWDSRHAVDGPNGLALPSGQCEWCGVNGATVWCSHLHEERLAAVCIACLDAVHTGKKRSCGPAHTPELASRGGLANEDEGVLVGAYAATGADSSGQVAVRFTPNGIPVRGVLALAGYTVGKDGLVADARRRILEDVLSRTELVVGGGCDANGLLGAWGQPGTDQRLARVKRSIICDLNLARRRTADMREAIADWESDLAWLDSIHPRRG